MGCQGTNHCRRDADFTCADCGLALCADHGDKWTQCGPWGGGMHRRSKAEPKRRAPAAPEFVNATTIWGLKRSEAQELRRMRAAVRSRAGMPSPRERVRRTAIHEAMAETFAAEYRAGATVAQLAARHHVSTPTVLKGLRHADCPRRPRHSHVNPATTEKHARIASRYADGLSLRQVAAEFGMSIDGVRYAAIKMGVKMRPAC